MGKDEAVALESKNKSLRAQEGPWNPLTGWWGPGDQSGTVQGVDAEDSSDGDAGSLIGLKVRRSARGGGTSL